MKTLANIEKGQSFIFDGVGFTRVGFSFPAAKIIEENGKYIPCLEMVTNDVYLLKSDIKIKQIYPK